jgi:hypothetical protein
MERFYRNTYLETKEKFADHIKTGVHHVLRQGVDPTDKSKEAHYEQGVGTRAQKRGTQWHSGMVTEEGK